MLKCTLINIFLMLYVQNDSSHTVCHECYSLYFYNKCTSGGHSQRLFTLNYKLVNYFINKLGNWSKFFACFVQLNKSFLYFVFNWLPLYKYPWKACIWYICMVTLQTCLSSMETGTVFKTRFQWILLKLKQHMQRITGDVSRAHTCTYFT